MRKVYYLKGASQNVTANQKDKSRTDYSVIARVFAIKVRFQIIPNYKNFKYLLNMKIVRYFIRVILFIVKNT